MYSTVTETTDDPRWPHLQVQLMLSCGHVAIRPQREKPYQRVKCKQCHPREETQAGTGTGQIKKWARGNLRMSRAGRAVSRWQRRHGKSMF